MSFNVCAKYWNSLEKLISIELLKLARNKASSSSREPGMFWCYEEMYEKTCGETSGKRFDDGVLTLVRAHLTLHLFLLQL